MMRLHAMFTTALVLIFATFENPGAFGQDAEMDSAGLGSGNQRQDEEKDSAVRCQPEAIENGSHNATQPVGIDGIVAYQCNEGFEMEGGAKLVCTIKNNQVKWNQPAPKCQAVQCCKLEAPRNGAMNNTEAVFETVVGFSCNAKFELIGSETRKCQSNGTWTGTQPRCDKIVCNDPGTPGNGHRVLKFLTIDSIVHYKCNPGHSLQGNVSRSCVLDEGTNDPKWTGELPSCEIDSCSDPGEPDNGERFGSDFRYTKVVHYSCNNGYVLKGSSAALCMEEKQWSHPLPRCTPIKCPVPTNLENGNFTSTGETVYDTVRWQCKPGYTRDGPESATCTADGTWNATKPFCKELKCEDPGTPYNGDRTLNSLTIRSTVTYRCHIGYSLLGEEERTCVLSEEMNSATWTGSLPSCNLVACRNPTQPTNGRRHGNEFTYKSLVRYSCNNGYDLEGSPASLCLATGEWSHPLPTCTQKVCDNPVTPENGVVSERPGERVGAINSTVEYTCQRGHVLVGPQRRTCELQDSSIPRWTGPLPACTIIKCFEPGVISDGNVQFEGTMFKDVAQYSCNQNFKLVGKSFVTCESNGQWSSPPPTCTPTMCQDPGQPANGGRTYDHLRVNGRMNYSCNYGYSLVGYESATCLNTLKWSSGKPKCIPIHCEKLSAPKNGRMIGNKITLTSSVHFVCNNGYRIKGAPVLVCLENCWSDLPPTCEVIDCGTPASIHRGTVTFSATTYGNSATYQCNTGFTIVGDSKIVCNDDEQWSSLPPLCESIKCSDPGIPNNGGRNISHLHVGGKVDYTCCYGYKLIGSRSATCLETKCWSHKTPTCTPIECVNPGTPQNGYRDGNNFHFMSSVNFGCSIGYHLVGVEKLVCHHTGNWSSSVPCCEVVDCGQPSSISNGAVSVNATTYGNIATYRCNSGFTLLGSHLRRCKNDGKWSGQPPRCTDGMCPIPKPLTYGGYTATGFSMEESINFYCLDGYLLMGNRNAVCQQNRTWSAKLPQCKILECGDPGAPTNGNRQGNNFTFGNLVSFSCNDGYLLHGSQVRFCQQSGEWSGQPATCNRCTCSRLDSLENGQYTSDGISQGSIVTWTCNPGYHLIGSERAACQFHVSGGCFWSGQPPTCKRIKCCEPPVPHNGKIISKPDEFYYNTTLAYQCDNNFRINGPARLRCIGTGQWDNDPPTCDPNCLLTTWSDWGKCSRSCGHGVKSRSRSVQQEPHGNGLQCPPTDETSPCILPECISCEGSYSENQTKYTLKKENISVAADLLFIVDESQSMITEHKWMPQMILYLEKQLKLAKVGHDENLPNRYSLVGFGHFDNSKRYGHVFTDAKGSTQFSASEFVNVTKRLELSVGNQEDGYQAIKRGIEQIQFRTGPDIAHNLILITDEDRDNLTGGYGLNRSSTKRLLRKKHFVMNAIVDHEFLADEERGMGVFANRTGYFAGRNGTYIIKNNTIMGKGFKTTKKDYSGIAHELGGAVWDLNILRKGNETALSFTNAFTAVKTAEIRRQVDKCQRCICKADNNRGSFLCKDDNNENRCVCHAEHKIWNQATNTCSGRGAPITTPAAPITTSEGGEAAVATTAEAK